MNLIDKKILFIGPQFFGYEKDIISELNRQGAEVNFIPENIDHIKIIYKLICSLPPLIAVKYIHLYFIKKIGKYDSYDIVFVIRGKWLDEYLLKKMKDRYNAKFIMYQWDSVENVPNVHKITRFFDGIYTFDKDDSMKYSSHKQQWTYRPLFYANNFASCSFASVLPNIDLLYIGSLHSGRARFLKIIQAFAKENHLKLKSYLFMKKTSYIKRRYINRDYLELKNDDIHYESMERDELIALIKNSSIIVDYTNPNQSGMTMRSIECLGAKKKLITNNKNIVDELFFDSNNIFVYDEMNFNIPYDFLFTPYKKIDEEIYNYYSIETWVENIFESNCHD